MIKNTKFRSKNNVRFTQQLFYEMSREMPDDRKTCKPMFSLHDDVEGLVNFRKEYVRDMDTTGYKTATRLLESYDHFLLLQKGRWFREAKEEWDREIAAKMQKEAIDKLRGILNDDDSKPAEQIAAAKALLTKSKEITKEPVRKPGRPSKDAVEGRMKEEVRLTKDELDDMKRIGLVN
jgi:hypothetical protein